MLLCYQVLISSGPVVSMPARADDILAAMLKVILTSGRTLFLLNLVVRLVGGPRLDGQGLVGVRDIVMHLIRLPMSKCYIAAAGTFLNEHGRYVLYAVLVEELKQVGHCLLAFLQRVIFLACVFILSSKLAQVLEQ